MGGQTIKASSKQEDGAESTLIAMVVHGVTDHPVQGSTKRVRLQRAPEWVDL